MGGIPPASPQKAVPKRKRARRFERPTKLNITFILQSQERDSVPAPYPAVMPQLNNLFRWTVAAIAPAYCHFVQYPARTPFIIDGGLIELRLFTWSAKLLAVVTPETDLLRAD